MDPDAKVTKMKDGRTRLAHKAECQRSFNFPQVWSSKIPPPLVESNNDNYAGGRSWAGRLRPVQVAVGARQRVHGEGSVHGPGVAHIPTVVGLTTPDLSLSFNRYESPRRLIVVA